MKDFRASALEIAASRGFTDTIAALQNPLFTSSHLPAQHDEKPRATIAVKPPLKPLEGSSTSPKNVVSNVLNKERPRASVKVRKVGSEIGRAHV